jgi:hypothetical protein
MPAPDPSTIVYCVACRRPLNGKGWFGPGCQCNDGPRDALRGAHGRGTHDDQPK